MGIIDMDTVTVIGMATGITELRRALIVKTQAFGRSAGRQSSDVC